MSQQAFEDAKDRLRAASRAVEVAEREFRANKATGLPALKLARDYETRCQLDADRAALDVLHEETRELIAEARAALDAANNRKYAALAAQPKARGISNVMHPQMQLFNDDIYVAFNTLHDLEAPIKKARFDLEWAERAYARQCKERQAVDNHICCDYTEYKQNHPRAARQEEYDDMFAYRDFTPWIERCRKAEERLRNA